MLWTLWYLWVIFHVIWREILSECGNISSPFLPVKKLRQRKAIWMNKRRQQYNLKDHLEHCISGLNLYTAMRSIEPWKRYSPARRERTFCREQLSKSSDTFCNISAH
jgi:hypothetical protein